MKPEVPGTDRDNLSSRLLEVIRTQTEIVKLGLDLGEVIALVSTRAQQLTRASGAVVELAEGDEMVYRATSGIAAQHLGLRLRRGNSLSGLCVAEGRPLCCVDSETDDRVDRAACRKIGLRSMIVVPLRHHDVVVGVLKVMAGAPHAFDDSDVHILGLMSDLIAAAMFHAVKTSELFIQATHDALTGLPNRALFYERLRHCLALAQREACRCGVLSLDMDGLKSINDQLGHRTGDAALCEFAARLKQAARASDTVARLGGDEFGMILNHLDDRSGADAQARRLSERIAPPFAFEDKQIPLDASIGIAIYPDDSDDLARLLDVADQSMYVAKRKKKLPESR